MSVPASIPYQLGVEPLVGRQAEGQAHAQRFRRGEGQRQAQASMARVLRLLAPEALAEAGQVRGLQCGSRVIDLEGTCLHPYMHRIAFGSIGAGVAYQVADDQFQQARVGLDDARPIQGQLHADIPRRCRLAVAQGQAFDPWAQTQGLGTRSLQAGLQTREQ